MTKTRFALLKGLCLAAALCAVGTRQVSADSPKLVVVVAEASPVKSISKADLRRIFSGEPVEIEGKRMIPINLPPVTSERQTFDRAILGLNPLEMPKYWIDRRIRAQGMPPKTASTTQVAGKAVAALPGSITYMPANAVLPGLRALAIDGQDPQDPAYPLNL